MKKVCSLMVLLALMLSLTACGGSVAKVKSGANEYVGQNVDTVIAELSKAGFSNFETETIADLTSSSSISDGSIESITIGDTNSFVANDKFSPDSKVLIVYHTIPKLNPPLASDSIQSMDYTEIAQLFSEAGFVNVSTDEVYDLDPDALESEYQNDVLVNGTNTFAVSDEVPFDASIQVVGHFPYEKYNVDIAIDFIPNLLFNKYDVTFSINGVKQGTMEHGDDAECKIRLREGEYTLTFAEDGSSSVKGETTLSVSSDVEAAYSISCHSDRIGVEVLYVDSKGALADDEAKMICNESAYWGKNYRDVVGALKNLGFTNINVMPQYDIFLGLTAEESVADVSIGGKDDFKRGDIFKKDIDIVVSYHMPYDAVSSTQSQGTAGAKDTTPSKAEETYDLDKNLVVAMLEKDSKYDTRYNVVFAEYDASGTPIEFYTFDDSVNPRDMGKAFNAIGDLPSWFYVGATVHVKANLYSNKALKIVGCTVTPAEAENKPANTSTNIDMPVLKGTNLATVVETAKNCGVSKQPFSDEDWGHGTKMRTLENNAGSLTIDIVYSSNTKEILCAQIVTFATASTQEQHNFIKEMSKVLCPDEDATDVSKWVSSNVGSATETTINSVVYELSVGPAGNAVYSANERAWEEWDSSLS